MPYLRFSRDKRGYENTYVLHAGGMRGKTRPRMLYWFRTPPNVKVGRLPLDADAIRAVEDNNPDVTFDWNKMLKVRASARVGTDTHPDRAARKRPRRSPGSPAKGPPPTEVAETDRKPTTAVEDAPHVAPPVIQGDEPPVDPQLLEAKAHLGDAEETGDGLEAPVNADRADGEEQHPVVTLMGHDTLARLRARYAEIQARISEKLTKPADLEAMRTRAEALNPDRWKTVETAMSGIERFEADVEAIKAQIGRRPPRSRRTQTDSESV